MPTDLQTIVQRMIDAGEPEESIADVIRAFPSQQPATEKSIGGFLGNIGSDIAGTVSGLASMIGQGAQASNAAAFDRQAPNSPIAQQVGQRMKASNAVAFDRAAPPQRTVGAALDEAYERPVSTAMALNPGAQPAIGLGTLATGLKRTGVRAMRGALKAPTGELNKMQGSAQAGLDKVSERVAQTALRERVNPLRGRGLETIQSRVDALDEVRDAAIASAPQVPSPGSGVRQLRSLRPVTRKYGPQSQTFAEQDLRDIGGLRAEMRRNPAMTERNVRQVPREEHLVDEPFMGADQPSSLGNTAYGQPTDAVLGPARMKDLTPNEMNRLNKGDNRALTGKFGKVGDAEIDARKAVRNERSAMLDEAVPGVRAQGQRMRDLIDLRNVANVARRRGEGRDLFGINDVISLSAGRPGVFMASTMMKPAAQAGLGGALHRTGAALPSQIDLTELYRLALIQQLTEGEQ